MPEHPVRYADLRCAVGPHRDPVRAGERPEVVIEGAILLHDDDDVIDRPGDTGRARPEHGTALGPVSFGVAALDGRVSVAAATPRRAITSRAAADRIRFDGSSLLRNTRAPYLPAGGLRYSHGAFVEERDSQGTVSGWTTWGPSAASCSSAATRRSLRVSRGALDRMATRVLRMTTSCHAVRVLRTGFHLGFQRAPAHEPPTWPDPRSSMQSHLHIKVRDLDAAEGRVLELGGARFSTQPAPTRHRVLADPAGHPFCLVPLE